jgi:competence ComEA-like helix-hairpin-helix protein
VLSLLLVVIIINILPRISAKNDADFVKADPTLLAAIDTIHHRKERHPSNDGDNQIAYRYEQSTNILNGELFVFDPNKLDLQGWEKLGLNRKTINTINNYRIKGGRFYKPEDLQKIWGLPEGFYERVKSYISIPEKEMPGYKESTTYIKPTRKAMEVEINSADTTAYISLPGIGGKLANRIINFRDKLGGFYSVDQVGQTYGVPDSTFQKIRPYPKLDKEKLRKININTASKDDLKAHPYIRWNIANSVVEYRNQHGSYKSLDDLKKITLIDDVTFEKIKHYLSL